MGIVQPPEGKKSNATAINKIPDYAKDYKNEFLFIRGIDKCFKYFLDNINKADCGVFKNHRVDKINKFIDRFEKAQRLNYLNDTNNIEIDEINISYSSILLERLLDFSDYYVDDDFEFDEEMFASHVDVEFPGYKNLFECIELFHSKFKIVTNKYKFNWHDSDDESVIDSDDIYSMFGSDDESEFDSDSSFNDY